ncbi:MAG: hypothetical protein JW751_11735 [Polyangiaceae bacterium]|nr:hypothetical protein [Polyangiaceae bacterium]
MTDRDLVPSFEDLRAHPAAARWAARVVAQLLPELGQANEPLESKPKDSDPASNALTIAGVDVAAVLERGPRSPLEAGTVSALLILGMERELVGREVRDEVATGLIRLTAEGPYDPLGAADVLLKTNLSPFWTVVARALRATGNEALPPGEATVALAALATASDPPSRALALELDAGSSSPVLRRAALAAMGPPGIRGELGAGPRSGLATALCGATGLLLVTNGLRVLGRICLGYRRPVELRVTLQGVELEYQTRLLGRVLRDRRTLFPRSGIARVGREVRYGRLALYAGLAALSLGTYIGVGLFLDGLRVPGTSPSLLGLGLLAILLGLFLDFALTWLSDFARGRCRIFLEPVRGRPFAICGLEPSNADALLRRLAVYLGSGTVEKTPPPSGTPRGRTSQPEAPKGKPEADPTTDMGIATLPLPATLPLSPPSDPERTDRGGSEPIGGEPPIGEPSASEEGGQEPVAIGSSEPNVEEPVAVGSSEPKVREPVAIGSSGEESADTSDSGRPGPTAAEPMGRESSPEPEGA